MRSYSEDLNLKPKNYYIFQFDAKSRSGSNQQPFWNKFKSEGNFADVEIKSEEKFTFGKKNYGYFQTTQITDFTHT